MLCRIRLPVLHSSTGVQPERHVFELQLSIDLILNFTYSDYIIINKHYFFMIPSKLTKTQPNHSDLDWRMSLTRLEGAYADSTLRAYRTDASTFVRWCDEQGYAAFPASPEHLSNFITHEAQRCSGTTLKRRLAAIGKLHRLMKLENPVNDEEVKLALRRALRRKFIRPNQA